MRALYLDAAGLSLCDDLPIPRPRSDEALIRVLKAGICATDLELVKGYKGFRGVLGHEFVGRVEEASDRDWIGRRVVGTINLGCGSCRQCLGSGPEHCRQRRVVGIFGRDGAFAEYLTLPIANLLPVADEIADDVAVFTEPLAAALRIREQVTISPSARLAVVGPGRLGLLIAQVLALTGSRLTVLGRRRESLALPEELGLDTGLAADAEADSFDLVVESTGNEAGFSEALRLLRPGGTLVLKSTFHGAATVDLTKLVVDEIRVVGSRCGPFEPALRLLARGGVKVRPLIDAEYPLSSGLQAMEHAARPGVRKVLLRCY
ncbi:MAG: alcohol dehydrogenase catalytic domain-containing protein [Thermoanaerobaculia bacterium]